MSNDVLIRADNVGKKFCRSLKKSLLYGMQDVSFDLMGVDRSNSDLRKGEFWANKGITFELRRGECLGLIGKNGAGKTTLLKMLNGLIKPDAGHIEMKGRVGALIALGAGFNPILTGRENIFINGSVLGLSKKEINSKLDEIINFAEIEEFIDTPVQNYSSGMQVRLGFAVSTTMNPDILLLDEVLAVGDLNFRMKCYNRIDKLRENTAVILVSHSLEHISRICTEVLLLNNGREKYFGNVAEGLVIYENEGKINNTEDEISEFMDNTLERVNVSTSEVSINSGDSLTLELLISAKEKRDIDCRFTVYCISSNKVVGTCESKLSGDSIIKAENIEKIYKLYVNEVNFRPGTYQIAISLFDAKTQKLLFSTKGKNIVNISGSVFSEMPGLQKLLVEEI
jgi:lipopolysaccharide transport system ATP-binding protein